MMEMDGSAELYAKLAWVMGEIGELEKKGRNENFNYDFIRDVDVANALRPLLAEAGVAMLVGMEDVQQQRITSGRGNEGTHTLARMSVTFADSETGATVTVPWYGEAIDYQDKGVNKCATAGVKYALLKTFLIGSDDDPDAEAPRGGSQGSRGNGRSSVTGDMDEILSTELNFGKFKGDTLGLIADVEPGYIEWLADNWQWEKGRAMARTLLESLDGAPAGPAEAPAGGNGGNATPTDFWRLAKQLKAAGDVTDDEINAVKDNHQVDSALDWDGAIEDLKAAASANDEEDIPF